MSLTMKMTTLCYIEQDGKYLMLHRTKKKKDINKDKWIGAGGRCVSFSPIPSARAVPLRIQYGTSAPIFTPRSISSFLERFKWNRRLTPTMTAAASELPPAIPAATGINFRRSILTPFFTSNSSIRSFAALYTRLSSLVGR